LLNTWPSRCGASPRRIEKEEEALSGSEYLGGKEETKVHKSVTYHCRDEVTLDDTFYSCANKETLHSSGFIQCDKRNYGKQRQNSSKSSHMKYLPIERIPLTCLTVLNSPTIDFSACCSCSSFIGAFLPPTTAATCATKPLSTCNQEQFSMASDEKK
jgi:hypothetical protein